MVHDMKPIANYLFEAGILNRTPRSWCWYAKTGDQSVAEHIHRMLHIAFALAKLEKADVGKMLAIALFHDFAEGRTGDLNYIHQKYDDADEARALSDMAQTVPFGEDIEAIMKEYVAHETIEAKLVKDADNIEFLLSLKEEMAKGNQTVKTWIPSTMQRFKTEAGKQLAQTILDTDPDEWWFSDKEQQNQWWVDRHGKKG